MPIKSSVIQSPRPHWSGLMRRDSRVRAGWTPFDRNENADRILQGQVVDILLHHVDHNLAGRYTDYYSYYQNLADHLQIDTSNLLITGGCDEAIRLSFLATLNPGDRLLMPSVTYRGAATNSDDLDIVPVLVDESPTGISDGLATGVDMAYICSPNNPTGTTYPVETLKAWADKYPRTVFFIDATYTDFTDLVLTPLLDCANVIIGRSLSKSWGLAGSRMGYIMAHPDITEAITRIRPIMSVSSATLQVTKYLVDHHHIVTDSIQRNVEGIAYMHRHFADCDIRNNQSINHLVFRPPADFRESLVAQRLLVGELPDGFIRMTTMPVREFNQICSNTYK